jgi:hypothetical protein
MERSLGGTLGTLVTLGTTIVLWMRTGRTGHWFRRWVLMCLVVDAILLVTGSVLSDVMYVVERGWNTTEPNDETT